MASAGKIAFQLSFQISPIILTGGIAGAIPGGMLPIIALSQAANFLGLIGGGDGFDDLDNYLLQFKPLPGATLIDQKIGMYPFANQQVAANAVIRDPLVISVRMDVSAKEQTGGYAGKLVTLLALQATLAQHNNMGGTYTVVTPSGIFANLVMLTLRDVSRSDTHQPQNAWQWDFIQPLITLQAALQAQAQMNSTMGQIGAGVPAADAGDGLSPTIGATPSLATPSIAPVASNLTGASIGGAPPYAVGPAGASLTSQIGSSGVNFN